MSSTQRAAEAVKTLKEEEWRTLRGLERASVTAGFADEGMISRLGRLPPERVAFALSRLNKRGLVSRAGANYVLSQPAAEALALHEYADRDLIVALGAIIAKGKESDVYEAFDEEGGRYAVKFFKLGRTSFTSVRRKRFVDRSKMRSWLSVNYEAAKKEYSALKRLEGLSPCFPKALAYGRSTVLLEEISGVRLSARPELEDPAAAVGDILGAARTAYVKAGLVNGDLSEYNILTDGSSFWLIDWPQAVAKSHPNAGELLAHDVATVVKFFGRAYGEEVDQGRALAFVRGETSSLE